MKAKMRYILVFSLVSINCFAEKWTKTCHKGDELTDVSPYNSYSCGNDTGRVVFYDNDSQIKVIAAKYSFFKHETRYINGNAHEYSVGTWGLYKDGKLQKKGCFIVSIEEDKMEHGYLLDRENREAPINFDILALHTQLCLPGCSVRLVLSRYGDSDFDVTLPYNPDFEKFDYIPYNQERRRLEEQIKVKQAELEKANQELERITTLKKKQYVKMTNDLEVLVRRYNLAVKNNCPLSAKKHKEGIECLKKKIVGFKKANQKDFPKVFE